MDPLTPRFHHAPLKIADGTYLIRQLVGEQEEPVSVYMNSMVILGKEPVIVDTGLFANREQWSNDVFGLVDPEDVKWIFLSHDDSDHTGNLRYALELCPNVTLVTNWFTVERLVGDIHIPLSRMRWVNDGETFDAGDRVFAAIRPPVFDSPTTRGLYDPKTGVYWGSDTFATPVLGPVDNVNELDPQFWKDGLYQFASLVSPWHALTDVTKFGRTVKRIEDLKPTVVTGGHSPMVSGAQVAETFRVLYELPNMAPVDVPGQEALEAMLAASMEPIVEGKAA